MPDKEITYKYEVLDNTDTSDEKYREVVFSTSDGVEAKKHVVYNEDPETFKEILDGQLSGFIHRVKMGHYKADDNHINNPPITQEVAPSPIEGGDKTTTDTKSTNQSAKKNTSKKQAKKG